MADYLTAARSDTRKSVQSGTSPADSDPITSPATAAKDKRPQIPAATAKEVFVRRRGMLYNERSSWVETWRFLADYFYPRKGRWFITQENRGERRDQKIIDGTTRYAVRDFSAGMVSGITSPSRPWFRFQTADRDMMKRSDVKDWCYLCSALILDALGRSNFYNVLPSVYGEFGVFGTMAMYEMEDYKDLFRFFPATINSYMISQDPRLNVDTIYRDRRMTVRQLVDMFGFENCSQRTQNMYKTGSTEQWIDLTHAIEPNTDKNPFMADARGMDFRSVWYEWGEENNKLLRTSGFRDFPALVARWDTTGEDVYGVGPGHDALGDAKALMYQQKQKAKAIDKLVDPPMVGSPALKKQRASLLPGDVTYVDGQAGQTGFAPAYVIKPDPQLLLEDLKELQERIETAFYRDLFQMLANDDRSGVTAREIEEKHEEKLLMLGPALQHVNTEFLDPTVNRTFKIMMRRGALPPPPKVLQGKKLDIEYISILAQAMKMVSTGASDQFLGYITQASNAKQLADATGLGDKIDFDEMTDDYADKLGVKPSIIVDDDVLKQKRAARAKAQAAAQAQALAAPAAQAGAAAKNLASAPMGGDTALSRMLGMGQNQPGAGQ